MPSHFLRDLGYDTRRMRVLLTLGHWEWLDAYARRLGTDAAGAVALFTAEGIDNRMANDRVILTPLGQAAASESAIPPDPPKFPDVGRE